MSEKGKKWFVRIMACVLAVVTIIGIIAPVMH